MIDEGAGAEWNTDFVVGRPDGRNASDRRFSLTFASPGSHEGRTAPEKRHVDRAGFGAGGCDDP